MGSNFAIDVHPYSQYAEKAPTTTHLLLVESAFHITLIYEETIRYEQSSLHMVSQTVNEYLCG